MNVNGSGQTNLTNNPTADYVPSWSPNGKQIAFLRSVDRGPAGGFRHERYGNRPDQPDQP
jgi:Tol biopolymer transport system component